MAFNFAHVGLVGGVILTFFSMIINRKTLLDIVFTCNKASCDVCYASLAEKSFGKLGR